MQVGDKVIILDENPIWNSKEGIIENITNNLVTVFVDFIPDEGKRVRQTFDIDTLQVIGE